MGARMLNQRTLFYFGSLLLALLIVSPVNAEWLNLSPTTVGSVYRFDAECDSFTNLRDGNGIGNSYDGTTYLYLMACAGEEDKFTTLERMILIWNTSALPDDAVINEAYYKSLFIVELPGLHSGGWEAALTEGSVVHTDDIVASDYQRFGNTVLSDYVNFSGDGGYQYNTFNLTADGRSYINLTGETTMFLRMRDDINNTFTGEWVDGEVSGLSFVNSTTAEDQCLNISYSEATPTPTPTSNATTTPQSTTYYAPVHIRFTVLSSNAVPLDNVTVTASFNQSTLADDSWIYTLYGMSADVNPSLISSNATMSGVTDLTGSIVFTMFPSFQYILRFTDAVRGINHQVYLYPQLTEYTIWIPGAGYTQREAEALNTSLFITEISASELALNMTYHDTADQTVNLTFFVMGVNQTFVNTQSWTGPPSNLICASYVIPNVRGESFYWGFYSMGSTWPNSTPQAKGVTTKGPSGVLVDLGFPSLEYYVWLSFLLIMLVGGLFTSERTSYFGVVIVPMVAGLFVWFGWLQDVYVAGIIALMIIIGALVYIKSQYRRSFGIGGPGEMFINIVFYLIIIQASIGLVNSVMVNPYGNFAPTQTNVTETMHYTMTDAQASYDPSSTNSVLKVADIVLATVTLPFTILITFINIVWSIINVYGTLTEIFYLNSTPATRVFAAILEGVWLILLVRFIWVIFWKPPPGEATL